MIAEFTGTTAYFMLPEPYKGANRMKIHQDKAGNILFVELYSESDMIGPVTMAFYGVDEEEHIVAEPAAIAGLIKLLDEESRAKLFPQPTPRP